MFTYHLSKIESETNPAVLLFWLMCPKLQLGNLLSWPSNLLCQDPPPHPAYPDPNSKPREVPKPKPQCQNPKPQTANPNLQTPTSRAQPYTLNLKDQLISSHPVTFRHSEQPPPLAPRLIYTVMVNRSCTLIDEVIDWCCRCQCISPPPRTSINFAF